MANQRPRYREIEAGEDIIVIERGSLRDRRTSDQPAAGPRDYYSIGDAVSALSWYIVFLFAIPSRLVFAPLGAAGTPAQLFAVILFGWFLANYISRNGRESTDRSPVVLALVIFGTSVLVSYVVATTRPIDPIELRSADRGLISVASWAGIVLLATYGIRERARLDTLIRRATTAGGAIAALGLVQFATGHQLTDRIVIPGLSLNAVILEGDRNGFTRPAGTATHPIEFGVVLSMLLPLALHFALESTQRTFVRRWLPVAVIAFAIPISISRSAILGCAIVLIILLPTWSRARRRYTYLAVVLLIGTVYVTVPGLLGTFRNLFFGLSSDSSALSRTDSYSLAGQFFSRAPIFGRGFGTFLPAYRILDNQYLGTLIETGVFGLACLLALFATTLFQVRQIRARSKDPYLRSLAQALAASVAAGVASLATFDAFSFPMAVGTLMLCIGCVGSLRQLEARSSIRTGGATRSDDVPLE